MASRREDEYGQPSDQVSEHNPKEELLVWPWMAVVENIQLKLKDGKYVGDSGKKLKEEWVSKGYSPAKVHTLWTHSGQSSSAIVQFKRDWDGFKNAVEFEKMFELENRGRRDWYVARNKGDKLYAWMAKDEDYSSKGPVGYYLRKHGDLRTLSSIEMEEKRKDAKLVSSLTKELEVKNRQCDEIKLKISGTESSMWNVIRQKEAMVQAYYEEMEKLQKNASDQVKMIFIDNERRTRHLEAKMRKLELLERELEEREVVNDSEKRKLEQEKMMNERAILEQKKANEGILKLAEDQKREKQKLHERIIELEKKLDAKQALELEIERIRGAVEVMKHMSEEGDVEAKRKMESIEKELREKEEELDDLGAVTQALIVKERNTSEELQGARKELINGFKDSRATICVKRVGELDKKPFYVAAKRKYMGEEAMVKATEWLSLWEENLRDPSWHPFKIISVEEDQKEVIDEEDEKLKSLREVLGEEVYETVTTALRELNAYNPMGRYPLPELWNSREGRRASVPEGVSLLLRQFRFYKRRRN